MADGEPRVTGDLDEHPDWEQPAGVPVWWRELASCWIPLDRTLDPGSDEGIVGVGVSYTGDAPPVPSVFVEELPDRDAYERSMSDEGNDAGPETAGFELGLDGALALAANLLRAVAEARATPDPDTVADADSDRRVAEELVSLLEEVRHGLLDD